MSGANQFPFGDEAPVSDAARWGGTGRSDRRGISPAARRCIERGRRQGGMLLTGDIIQVVADRKHVSFMHSYPNYVPLPASAIKRIAQAVEPLEYDRVYGAFWDMVIERGGKQAVQRSAERDLRAIGSVTR